MKILLDTAPFLWLNLDRGKMSRAAMQACEVDENELYLSSVSAWEISVKYTIGTLRLPAAPISYIATRRRSIGAFSLPMDEEAAIHFSELPCGGHKDPFDRMLVCQAVVHGMVIVSPDDAFDLYPVRRLW